LISKYLNKIHHKKLCALIYLRGKEGYQVSENAENLEKFSVVLEEVYSQIPPEGITLEDLLDLIGERGLFMTCMILTAPFLLPVSIPGSSIPFGTTIFLISLRIIFNRSILIPKQIMDHRISHKDMVTILKEILRVLKPIERVIKPRICILSRGNRIRSFNGFMLAFGGVLLVTPILAPLGDFFPAYGIMFISLGTLENDGYLVLAGYAAVIGTAIYYALIFAVGVALIIFLITYIGHYL
jgi:hypothetical protein